MNEQILVVLAIIVGGAVPLGIYLFTEWWEKLFAFLHALLTRRLREHRLQQRIRKLETAHEKRVEEHAVHRKNVRVSRVDDRLDWEQRFNDALPKKPFLQQPFSANPYGYRTEDVVARSREISRRLKIEAENRAFLEKHIGT